MSKAKIASAVATANEIVSHYQLNFREGRHTYRSLDKLRELAADHLGKTIEFYCHPLSFSGQPIKGFCLTFDDRYEVVLLSGMNFCWQRLVQCKEIFQVIIDEDNFRIADVQSLVNQAVVSVPQTSENLPLLSEALAEISALEFLFPFSDRKRLLQQSNGSPDFPAIAEQYKIPSVMVERYLSKPWMTMLDPDL